MPPMTNEHSPSTYDDMLAQFAYEIHESFHVGCDSFTRPGCITFIERKFNRTFGEVLARSQNVESEPTLRFSTVECPEHGDLCDGPTCCCVDRHWRGQPEPVPSVSSTRDATEAERNSRFCLCVCHGDQRVSGSHVTKCCVFTPPEASVSSTPVQSASEECPICTSYSAMFGETCGFHGSVPVGQTSATPVPDRCAADPHECFPEPDKMPATWAEFEWPHWVPQAVRDQVESFWGDDNRRRPRQWAEAARGPYNHAPCLIGCRVALADLSSDMKAVNGRYVYAWNNIGRVIRDDGSYKCVSNHAPKSVTPAVSQGKVK